MKKINRDIIMFQLDFKQKLAKTFSYIRECNIVCIGREEEKK